MTAFRSGSVAASTSPPATRCAVAGAAGEDAAPELLSFHYLNAQQYAEAWEFSLLAAERAKEVHANFEAAEFFERALVAGRRLEDVSAAQLASVHEELGDAQVRSGGYASAASSYRAARRLVRGDPPAEARVVLKLARVQGWLDRYSTALRWITKGLGLLEAVDGGAPSSGARPAHVLVRTLLRRGGQPHAGAVVVHEGRGRGRGVR